MIWKKLADYILKVVLDSLPSFFWRSKFLLLLFIKQLMKFNIFVFLTFGTWYGFENCCQKVHKVFIHPHGLPFHFSHWSAHRTFINFSLLGTDFLIFYYYYFLQTVNDLGLCFLTMCLMVCLNSVRAFHSTFDLF